MIKMNILRQNFFSVRHCLRNATGKTKDAIELV